MKMLKKLSNYSATLYTKITMSLVALMVSSLSYADDRGGGVDVVEVIWSGSIGKTLGKSGLIWGALVTVSFVVAGFYASIKKDPKEFIPAFIIMAIVSTVTGAVLTR